MGSLSTKENTIKDDCNLQVTLSQFNVRHRTTRSDRDSTRNTGLRHMAKPRLDEVQTPSAAYNIGVKWGPLMDTTSAANDPWSSCVKNTRQHQTIRQNPPPSCEGLANTSASLWFLSGNRCHTMQLIILGYTYNVVINPTGNRWQTREMTLLRYLAINSASTDLWDLVCCETP